MVIINILNVQTKNNQNNTECSVDILDLLLPGSLIKHKKISFEQN